MRFNRPIIATLPACLQMYSFLLSVLFRCVSYNKANLSQHLGGGGGERQSKQVVL